MKRLSRENNVLKKRQKEADKIDDEFNKLASNNRVHFTRTYLGFTESRSDSTNRDSLIYQRNRRKTKREAHHLPFEFYSRI